MEVNCRSLVDWTGVYLPFLFVLVVLAVLQDFNNDLQIYLYVLKNTLCCADLVIPEFLSQCGNIDNVAGEGDSVLIRESGSHDVIRKNVKEKIKALCPGREHSQMAAPPSFPQRILSWIHCLDFLTTLPCSWDPVKSTDH
ncbi:hypothetical protein E5288_WYG009584 [Bos mutus]|uniref:Uncharacterized protein n=1 Tax=Bos mutus TaxID=72004 RepID=A0A6B0R0B2_9CETA|nr:hypothetical protein [Bos mutus]